ncbi:MAG: type I CRISPR-associated protein Cas7 [Planctomycetia bacterium]|nr:type I CRISPR-associated protein Cas7 [Planctomycetia bacterium]
MTEKKFLNRACGLLVIEVVNSNPNGDPDRESDPRVRADGYGEISPVSFKRKLRDLVALKEGPVWAEVGEGLKAEKFGILESSGREREKIKKMSSEAFLATFWDARLFGTTFLEKKKEGGSSIKTGVVQFGLGVSVAPVEIERLTNTNKAGVQEGKDKGMAPLGYRVVRHGVYGMPFFVNPTAAIQTSCTQEDVDLMCRLIPYAYSQTSSYVRSDVRIRHAWFMEHSSPLGSCSDFALLDAMKPVSKTGDKPSTCWEDYDVPASLPEDLRAKIAVFKDLVK